MAKISNRHIRAWEKFNNELNAFSKETGEDFATLYEDAYTTRNVKEFKMTGDGILTWIEDERVEREVMFDEDDAKDWLSFWKGCLRRAKRYWAMDAVELDRLQEGVTEDENND